MDNKPIINPSILDDYIRQIMLSYFGDSFVDRTVKYNFRCNVCGDSKKSKNKKRGWILKNKDPWMFYCFNGCKPMRVEHWMQIYFPAQYNGYIKDCLKKQMSGDNKIQINVKPKDPKPVYNDFQDTQYFVPITSYPNDCDIDLFNLAHIFCKKRYIPDRVWKKWYIAIDGKYKNRIVIPFINKEDKIYSYQCRTLVDDEPKYLGNNDSTSYLYNIYNIDRNQPVIIQEGPIDSEFVENCIALCGINKMNNEDIKTLPFKFWLLDNDDDGLQKSYELLMKGEYVFLWRKFIKDKKVVYNIKDINDYIIYIKNNDTLTFTFLKNYFSNSIFDSIWLVNNKSNR